MTTTPLLILWRERCRLVFDHLWRGENPIMTRDGAYEWLSLTLGVAYPRLSSLDVQGCVRVMRAAKALLQTHHRVGTQVSEALAAAGLE